ncbi:MAG: 50S ribosomal protein L10 [Candidatus Coatesbacteria bacterium]|nr:MAG: 50S ribosomal protein L10 [Candidatus Coatesbacteria bacterium]
MALTLEQKKNALSILVEEFGRAGGVIFTDFRGVNVDGMTGLRREMREKELRYFVSKRTLISRALNETEIEVPDEFLDGATGLVFTDEEPVAASKVVEDFRKEFPSFIVKGGIMGAVTLAPADIKSLAKTPPREELLAKFVSSLNSPISNLANVTAGILRAFIKVLNAVGETKGETEKTGETSESTGTTKDSVPKEDSGIEEAVEAEESTGAEEAGATEEAGETDEGSGTEKTVVTEDAGGPEKTGESEEVSGTEEVDGIEKDSGTEKE